MSSFKEAIQSYVGQKVAVICARYQYRGILSAVGEDCIILANPTSVEISGPSQSAAPQNEDVIGCSIVIKSDAIELFYQPAWVNAPLPGEDA